MQQPGEIFSPEIFSPQSDLLKIPHTAKKVPKGDKKSHERKNLFGEKKFLSRGKISLEKITDWPFCFDLNIIHCTVLYCTKL